MKRKGLDARAPVRVAAVVGGDRVPRWIASALREIAESDVTQLAVLLQDRRANRVDERTRFRTAGYRLYEALDHRIYKNVDDPFELVALPDCAAGPALTFDCADETFKSALRRERLDVIVFFEPDPDSVSLSDCATEGAWFFRHGDGSTPPYFRELHNQAATFRTALIADRGDHRYELCRSYAAVDLVSLQRGRAAPYWKTAQFLPRRLLDLHSGGWQRIAERADFSPQPRTPSQHPVIPANRTVLRHVARMALGVARRRAVRALFREQWFIAYRARVNGLAEVGSGPPFVALRSERARFFADPFLVERDGEAFIFCEDMTLADGKGLISYIRLTPAGPAPAVPVLDRPYHLSYPFVFDFRGETYMIPETSGARRVDLYRAASFPDDWEFVATLLDDIPAVDSTLLEHDGRLWLFTTVGVPGAAAVDELFLFSATSLMGKWEPHPMNPIVSDVRRARPAGRVFRRDGALIRLSQDCSGTYGRRIVMNRIEELSPTGYRETEVGAISPDWMPGNLASHTYTFSERYEVLDGRVQRAKFALLDRLLHRRATRAAAASSGHRGKGSVTARA
jgi:hypothetical protein